MINKITINKCEFTISKHAIKRMMQRQVSAEAVKAALSFGRFVYKRGAEIYAIGKKEIKKFLVEGINLSGYEGVQVVCSCEGTIVTTYRSKNFKIFHK